MDTATGATSQGQLPFLQVGFAHLCQTLLRKVLVLALTRCWHRIGDVTKDLAGRSVHDKPIILHDDGRFRWKRLGGP